MSFNIFKVLDYLYRDSDNRFSILMDSINGTPQQQYDSFAWTSKKPTPDPKPTLEFLEAEYTVYARGERLKDLDKYVSNLRDTYTLSYQDKIYAASSVALADICKFALDGDIERDWYTTSGEVVALSKSDFASLNDLGSKLIELIKKKEAEYIGQISISSDPDSIDSTLGYPANPYIGE